MGKKGSNSRSANYSTGVFVELVQLGRLRVFKRLVTINIDYVIWEEACYCLFRENNSWYL